MLITDDLNKLLEVLPEFIRLALSKHNKRKYLIEVVMDLGRRPEARFPDGPEYLGTKNIDWYDLDYCIKKLGNFSGDNRSGIEYTLHRISSIKNRNGSIIGLTCRVGRAIFGTISIIRDLLEKGESLLLLGKPGVGKTTAIREIARVLADEMEKRVVIIDTSNEIAGDGDIPHPAIGRARRMQVSRPELQHQVMIEAVENHMPEVIIIDEIGSELEALAARTIAERGVQLVGTAHGNYLESLIKNPTLADLIGGIQYVTLGDDEAKRRGSQKSIIERKASPAFNIAIEIHDRNTWTVHEKVDRAVDQILNGSLFICQNRKLNNDGSISIECNISTNNTFHGLHNINNSKLKNIKPKFYHYSSPLRSSKLINTSNFSAKSFNLLKDSLFYNNKAKLVQLYIYALNIQKIEAAIKTLQLPIYLTRDIINADFILAIRSSVKHNTKLRQIAKSKKITIYTVQNNTLPNIIRALRQMIQINSFLSLDCTVFLQNKIYVEKQVIQETYFAIEKIIFIKQDSVLLLPRAANLRKIQHKLIGLYSLRSHSFGEEPNRRLKIYSI